MKSEPPREEALFQAAAQLTGSSRAAFLDQACASDAALRQRLEALLAAHEASVGVLADEPAREVLAPTLDLPEPAPDEAVGMTLGRYKLRERLGEGGCGTVYVAEQTEPVRRKVALKVIKLGMDTREVIARFEAERQALAMMDHPNIAKVLDAGTTDAGRPYFVMELVRGIRITDYCDQANLSTKERLDLFIKVCQAIQHAHQKGIIHRDIKPGNILVTLHDGVPVPKVIDFGIAKATEGRLVDATVYTQLHQFMGTPAYMSPEQAEMSGLDVDTRSDIYSLGVLLYQLLTSKTPFDGKELLSMGLDAMRKTIREKEPMRPSTRLASLQGEELTTTAKRRSADAPKLIHLLQGDLDWIVMKALEKDRTRRYDTANGLALDIQRHLSNEPVVARPPSTAYKIQKAWQRNKLAFSAATAVALALVVGIGVSTWQAFEATKARKAEQDQRVAAQKAEATALAKQTEAEAAQKSAEAARESEAAQRRMAEARAYASDMNFAQQALTANNAGWAKQLLARHRPLPGQPDRRGWEWRYLWQQSRSDALDALNRESRSIVGLSVSHDGKWLAVRAKDAVSVWDLATRRQVMRTDGVWAAVAFSPTRPVLAMCGSESPGTESRLRFWDAEAGKFLPDPPPPGTLDAGGLLSLAFLADGQSMVTATRSNLSLRRSSDGMELATYPIGIRDGAYHFLQHQVGHPVHLAQGTNLLAVAEASRQIRVIDVTNGREIFKTTVPGGGDLASVALSADGRILAAGGTVGETGIRLWDVSSGRELGVLEGHRNYVTSLLFWPDGKTLASGGADNTIRIWDVEKKLSLVTLNGHRDEISRLALLPDKATLISGGRDGSVVIWDTRVVRQQRAVVTLPLKLSKGSFWSVSSGGEAILNLEPEGWLTRWHGPAFQQTERLLQITPPPTDACVSTDHRWLATGTGSGAIQIWDVPARTLHRELPASTGAHSPVTFLAGTTRLVVWNTNAQTLAVHDVVSGKQLSSWSDPDLAGGRVEIAPGGQWCLTGGRNATGWRVRQLSNGRGVGTAFIGDRAGVAFSADGRQLVGTLRSGVVERWDLPSLTGLKSIRGNLRGTDSAAFSADGRRLAVGGAADESLKIWDLESEQLMVTLPGEVGRCWRTVFSSDESTLIIQHDTGTLDIWRAPSWEEIAAAEAKEEAEGLTPTTELRPDDFKETTEVAVKVAALQAWFGQDAEYAATRERMLAWAADTANPQAAERVAKLACLRPASDAPQRESILALARRGVELGKNSGYLRWFHWALGMAEFRSGHYPAADKSLAIAAQSVSPFDDRLEGTANFFRAMSLFQQGKPAEARALFTATEANMKKPLPPADHDVIAANEFHDVIILWLACKEARALLQMPAPTAKP